MTWRLLRTLFTTLGLLGACNAARPSRPAPPLEKPPTGPVASANVFFFGHSLVDQDMPAMLGSLAASRGKSCTSHGQLGWGTALASHQSWNGVLDKRAPVGFVDENRAPFFAGEGKAQLATGKYDVLVLTESNGHTRGDGNETVKSALALIKLARQKSPDIRVFLYANWLDRGEAEFKGSLTSWQDTTERDIRWWESVADRVNTQLGRSLLRVIPGGPVLVKVTRAIEQGKLPGLTVNDLFRDKDTVHVNDRGFYVIALLHYAAIFRDTPLGLPAQTNTEDGPAQAFSDANAALVQSIVADAVKSYPRL